MSSDTTLTAAGGPYVASTTMQVAPGVTLTLEAGVVLTTGTIPFAVYGTLRAEGTSVAPVHLVSTRTATFETTGVVSAGRDAQLSLRHVLADGFAAPVVGDTPASVVVEDSRFWTAEWNPFVFNPSLRAAVFRHNEFVNSAPLSLFASEAPTSVVTDNRFVRTSATDPGSEALYLYGPMVDFSGNAFAPGSWGVVQTPAWGNGGPPIRVDAEGNYWGTTDPTAIGARIWDHADSLGNTLLLDFDPFLSEAPPGSLFVPLAPTGVNAVAGPGSANVSWAAPLSDGGSLVTSYKVTASPGGTSVTVPGTALSATVPGLDDGMEYSFVVSALNKVGPSVSSSPSGAVVPASPPPAPTEVSAVAGDGSASVSWTPPSVPPGGRSVTGFVVRAYPGGGATRVSSPASGPAVSNAVVRGLTNGRSYTFTVAAVNSVGEGAESDASTEVTPVGPPGAPGRPKVSVKTGRSATGAKAIVTWAAPVSNGGSAVTGYRVLIAKGGKPFGDPRVVEGATRKLVVRLVPGTYTFRVSALNAIGAGKGSPTTKVKVHKGK